MDLREGPPDTLAETFPIDLRPYILGAAVQWLFLCLTRPDLALSLLRSPRRSCARQHRPGHEGTDDERHGDAVDAARARLPPLGQLIVTSPTVARSGRRGATAPHS